MIRRRKDDVLTELPPKRRAQVHLSFACVCMRGVLFCAYVFWGQHWLVCACVCLCVSVCTSVLVCASVLVVCACVCVCACNCLYDCDVLVSMLY